MKETEIFIAFLDIDYQQLFLASSFLMSKSQQVFLLILQFCVMIVSSVAKNKEK